MWGSEKVPEAVVVAIYATTTASGTCETYENIIKYKKRSILFAGDNTSPRKEAPLISLNNYVFIT